MVTASGKPSGTATTITVIAIIRKLTKLFNVSTETRCLCVSSGAPLTFSCYMVVTMSLIVIAINVRILT